MYNDHRYHLGYFLFGIAVLANIDQICGGKYKPKPIHSCHGRNQESTSEALNAYYSAAVASTLTSLEILAAKMWRKYV